MVEVARRIVAFPQAAQRIALQMLAEEIDAMGQFRVVDPPLSREVAVPARQCEALRQNLLLAELRGGRCNLRHHNRMRQASAQMVDARNIIISVLRHDGSVAGELALASLLQNVMARQPPAVRIAPIADLMHEMLREELRAQPPETNAHRFETRQFREQQRQFGQQLAAVFLFIFVFQNERPQQAVAAQLRLIREDAAQMRPQFRRQRFVVVLMCHADEFGDDFRIEIIHIVLIDKEIATQHLARRSSGKLLAEQFRTIFAVEGDRVFTTCRLRRVDDFMTQIFLLVIDAQAVHQTAAETRRPAVFVIQPCVHVQFRRFVETGLYAIHPFVRQIACLQTAARMHEEAAQTDLFHLLYLPTQFFRRQFLIPAPERNGAVHGFGIA